MLEKWRIFTLKHNNYQALMCPVRSGKPQIIGSPSAFFYKNIRSINKEVDIYVLCDKHVPEFRQALNSCPSLPGIVWRGCDLRHDLNAGVVRCFSSLSGHGGRFDATFNDRVVRIFGFRIHGGQQSTDRN